MKKLRHYFEAYIIKLISQADPVKFVMTRPVCFWTPSKIVHIINQYEIIYTPQKAVKGQTLTNFLADHPLPAEWELSDEFPDEDVLFIEELPPWTMFFDGFARRNGEGEGVVLISPERQVMPFSFLLGETCSNNAAKYQALIIGLEMALDMKILQLDGDSKLIINQPLGSYEVKKEDILLYHQYASGLLERFDQVFLNHVPREENRKADALATLAMTMALGENESTKGKLFCRSFEGLFLRCLDKEEACQAMDEAHYGSCGARQSGPKLHFHIKRMGYLWTTMGLDVVGPLLKSSKGQIYGIPRYIITDNGTPFDNMLVKSLCEKLDFKQHKSSMYNAPANGLVEVFNKTFGNLLKNVIAKNKRDWHERIGEALWAY
ncbi:uncharacterized protein [Nicotiana tomentosiformis]|uniref:uncharacterized protein n=1 Tax=Nicotiana tomentosiformis TaxID=4098 RepID=UPI00388CE822